MQTLKLDWIPPLPRKAAEVDHPLHHVHLARLDAGFGPDQHEKVRILLNDDGTSAVEFYDNHNDMDGQANRQGRRNIAADKTVTNPDA